MGEFRDRSLRHYEKMMQRKPEQTSNKRTPRRCSECEYYQPRFRYRKCLYTRCRYGLSERKIFRDKPIPDKYSVMRRKVK